MLGRPYRWKGPVIHGRQLGRLLDYPTANIRPGCGLQPPHGVYAVHARVAGKKYGGVANLGVRPPWKVRRGNFCWKRIYSATRGIFTGGRWKWNRSVS